MPVRIPYHQVVVHRDGKNIHVPVGKPYEFTSDEIAHFHANNPESLRRPINEGGLQRPVATEVTSDDDGEDVIDADATGDAPATKVKAPKKPGKTAPVVDPDDDEL